MGRLAGFVVKRVRDQRQNGEVWHPAAPHNGNLQISIFLRSLQIYLWPTLPRVEITDNILKDPAQS